MVGSWVRVAEGMLAGHQTGEDVRDLMVAAVEHRFGRVNRLPVEIEWLTESGSLRRG